MKWTITSASKDGIVGALHQPEGSESQTYSKSFKLTGANDLEAEGLATEDTQANDIMPWARAAHGFEGCTFGELPVHERTSTKEKEHAKTS